MLEVKVTQVDDNEQQALDSKDYVINLVRDGRLLTFAEVTRLTIGVAVAFCRGNKTQAAKALGMDRRTLYRWLIRMAKEQQTAA